MRDPRRIDQMLETLREVWLKNPDLRLGQLIMNVVRPSEPCLAVYAIEDEALMRGLEKYPIASAQLAVRPELPRLNLTVIHASSLEKSYDFYSALGLRLKQEQHGTGPVHYAAELGDMVFEIYPAKKNDPTGRQVRLGFRVASVDACVEAALAAGGKLVAAAKKSPWGYRAVVSDPDGTKGELLEIIEPIGS